MDKTGEQLAPFTKLEMENGAEFEPPMKSVRALITETPEVNRKDIVRLSKMLHEESKRNSMTLNGSVFLKLLRKKLVTDRDLVGKAKEFWRDLSERQLYWVNLRKLTTDVGTYGHYESAIEMLDNREKLPFEIFGVISGCQNDEYPLYSVGTNFQKARIGRVFTVYKLLLIYSIYVVNAYSEQEAIMSPEILRDRLHRKILANTQYVYPIEVPPALHSLLSECFLYRAADPSNVMLICNSGYVFGGVLRPEAPYNRGLDCTSFTGHVTGCGRPLTWLYEIAWDLNKSGPLPSAWRLEKADEEDFKSLKLLRERHEAILSRGALKCVPETCWCGVIPTAAATP